jgi:hypothetical protein
MAFQVSPGINITERDLTVGVENVSLSTGGFVGPFVWGPALQVQNVASEVDLVDQFGEPDANNFQHWFSAAAFLAYSNNLKVVRAISGNALNATSEHKADLTGTVGNTSSTTITGVGTVFQTELVVGQTIRLYRSNVAVGTYETATVSAITSNTVLTVSAALADTVDPGNTYTSFGVLIKNDTHHDATFESGQDNHGAVAAKWPGDLGNSLKVSICPSAEAFQANVTGTLTTTAGSKTVTGTVSSAFSTDLIVGDYILINKKRHQVKTLTNTTSMILETAVADANVFTTTNWQRQWEYWSSFDGPPGTSAYATDHSGTTDEMHVVVADEDGEFEGLVDNAVEKYAYVSKASDGKSPNGDNNYYKNVLNRQSQYVWWLAHAGTTTNWGSKTLGLTFGSKSLPYTQSLQGGNDDNENVTVGQIETGWDLFVDPDSTDVSLLVTGPATPSTLGTYVVDNIAAVRKDAVAFLSPLKASVVNNIGSENASVTTDRNNLPSSSYAVMDNGWKYLYDKYNDVYRWVPLNGDIAGLAARTDQTNDSWFSPAGFSRGHVKNVVKLAWTPKQTDRDDLYKIGVNSVVSFPGQGILLYGDKTMLNRPSAFDRINVRRLFIALEKTIAQYAKDNLFEFNDEFTRSAFRNVVEPFLRTIKARRGITDFLVVCDGTNNTADVVDRNEFVGHIFVKPSRTINYIQLNFVAVRSGVSFQEVVGAV